MYIFDLMTNKMVAPVIDTPPYFSWKISSELKNVLQKSYRLRVFQNDRLIWDSGEVFSRRQSYIPYEGEALMPTTGYRWTVDVSCDNGETASAEAYFETASPAWQARWIESSIERVSMAEYKYGGSYPPVLFEKVFTVPSSVRRARVYATAYGVYRLTVNSMRPDDREFAPEFTAYQKLMYYQCYDVSALLHEGENRLSMLVGDGWYFSQQSGPVLDKAQPCPAVLFQLETELEDGKKLVIASDGSESCSIGSIIYSDLFQGEKQDLRKSYDEKHPVVLADCGLSHLAAQPMPPVRPTKLIPAKEVYTSPRGETIVDFGQVMAGRARIWIDLPEGAEVNFEYFEIPDMDGNYLNTMFAPQRDTVISAGNPFLHEAFFTFHGFRYIRVSGMEHVRKEDFTAVLLTTDKENAGAFSCSDERLNRLYQNVRWSQWNNMMSVPTDCPSREKAGWTGDLLIYAKTALQNENATPFLTSWLRSVRADQAEDGTVMIVSPYEKLYHTMLLNVVQGFGDQKPTGVAGWSDAIVWVPWDMYRVTGNELILRENYKAMLAWGEYILRTAREKRGTLDIPEEYDQFLWNTGFHFGEWLIPSQPVGGFEICKASAFYIAPFFGYETIRKLSRIADVLHDVENSAYFAQAAERMKWAIQEGLLKGGHMPEDLMGAYVLAFAFDLVPEDMKRSYADKLVSLIENNNNCLDTGFLATPFLLDVLSGIGRKDLAHALIWQNKLPSWLYEVEHGATAIWEAWNADEAQKDGRYVSFDHYAFGCVDDWIMRKLGGIDSDVPGFSHLIIAPEADKHLSWCHRSFESEAGTVAVRYDEHELHVTIPCNTTASVIWKDQRHEIGSGSYCFC